MARKHRGPPRPPGADDLVLLGGGRIAEQNAQPMLEMLALYAGSGLDPGEWLDAERQLADIAPDEWYAHPIEGGVARLVVMMARRPDDGAVALRIWGEDQAGIAERIDTLFDLCSMYLLSPVTD